MRPDPLSTAILSGLILLASLPPAASAGPAQEAGQDSSQASDAATPTAEPGTAARPRAAILIFDGVEIIDYTGPYEVLGQGGYEVYTVARERKPVTTAMGMSVNPTYTYQDSPPPDVLVVPGGGIEAAEDPDTIAWIQNTAGSAKQVLSVCNGAFLLARAGLLDGKSATTYYPLLDKLREAAPGIRVVPDQRFVDNGKIVTAAGLSSGIDGAFHILEKVLGRGQAQRIALHLEYDWDAESRFARGALADRLVPPLDRKIDGSWTLLDTSGDRDHWRMRWSVSQAGSPGDLRRAVGTYLGGSVGWSRRSGVPGRTEWMFRSGGDSWTALSLVGTPDPKTGALEVSVSVERQKR